MPTGDFPVKVDRPDLGTFSHRAPDATEGLKGMICMCSKGRIAIVTRRKEMPWGMAWVGIGLDGKGLWASTSPLVIFNSLSDYEAYLEAKLLEETRA